MRENRNLHLKNLEVFKSIKPIVTFFHVNTKLVQLIGCSTFFQNVYDSNELVAFIFTLSQWK